MTDIKVENSLHTPKARAVRLKEARKIAKLTLHEMSANGFINYNTLCGWESAKHGGLTEKGALRVVERLNQEGVKCSVEWLMYGVGETPESTHPMLLSHKFTSMRSFIAENIDLFKQIYPDFITKLIEDDAMSPRYGIGDFIMGAPLGQEKLLIANGKDVIVQLEGGSTLVRTLAYNAKHKTASLIAANAAWPEPVLADVKINRWAVVHCHLKYESAYDD